MTSPFSSLTAAVLNPQGSAAQAQKPYQRVRQQAQTDHYRTLRQMMGYCKSETRNTEPVKSMIPVLSTSADLLKFQAEMAEYCKAETPSLSLVGLGRSTRAAREVISNIDWEVLTLSQTGETLLLHSRYIPNGEAKLDEFRKRFNIDKKILLLWKIKLLARQQHWSEFLDLATEAVRGVPLNTIYRPRAGTSTLSGLSIANAISNAFNLPGTSQGDGPGYQESGAQFAAYLNSRYASGLGSESTLTSTLSSILSAVPGRQSGMQFYPLLPDAGGDASHPGPPICPNLLPASLCSRLHVLEFVNVAMNHGRSDIALALVPYISPASLRDKYGIHLGLKDTTQSAKFCNDAIESALARSSASGDTSNVGFVMKIISKASIVQRNPLSQWVSSFAPNLSDMTEALRMPNSMLAIKSEAPDSSFFVLQ